MSIALFELQRKFEILLKLKPKSKHLYGTQPWYIYMWPRLIIKSVLYMCLCRLYIHSHCWHRTIHQCVQQNTPQTG